MNEKRKLFLATATFPYGGGECNFVGPEIEFLKEKFDLTIISHATDEFYYANKELESEYKDIKIIRYPSDRKRRDYLIYGLLAVFDRDFWREVINILGTKKNIYYRLLDSITFYITSRKYYFFLKAILKGQKEFIYYSFWYTQLCYGAVMCKKHFSNMKIITRTHGLDLYQERCRGNRQPFKLIMDGKVDKILFACQYGKKYYINTFANGINDEKKYCLQRLGSKREDAAINKRRKDDKFVVVSCSYTIPLKRIDLIINALALINDIEIRWIHFGGGQIYENLCQVAKDKLDVKDNIEYELVGNISNRDIRDFYQNNEVDCFITTSETEGGCPMAIQEAMLFGIPIIGTDVGGITEMIQGNGILLPMNPNVENVKNAIEKILTINRVNSEKMKRKSMMLWKEMFDIDKNGLALVEELEM